MEFQITIAGEAGQGIAKSAEIVSKDFVSRGFYVFNYRDYGSLIRGGENFNVLRISDEPVYSNDWTNDFAIIFGKFSEHHLKKMKSSGISIGTLDGVQTKMNPSLIVKEIGANKIVENAVLLGALYKAMGQPIEALIKQMETFGKNAELNQIAAQKGYDTYDGKVNKISLESQGGIRYYVSGSNAISQGAIASGMDLYIAYPMTPATPVLHILARVKDDVRAIQLENEIGVISAGLGASFAGANVMVGTSGGGFALMNEALSLQGISEIPIVTYMCMRPGPATGIPTYTGQGDMQFVLNSGHGEYSKVVIAPGDPKEAFERTAEAFYLANKYRVLSVLLTDKHLAESDYTFDSAPIFRVKPIRNIVAQSKDYVSYKITEDGNSPRAVPGKGIARATSYEHDEMGYTVEESEKIEVMVEKRLRKAKTLEDAIKKLEPVTVHGNGKNLVISWGSTKGAVVDAIKQVEDTRFLQISYLKPFPSEEVKKEIEKSSAVAIIENSATGQIASLIRENTGIEIKKKILKYDGRPFGFLELTNKIKEMFK